ncbi:MULTISPECIES: hypothetical protein [unclassified Paenibacillus]|uniref:hypothetical protein n=1 Tax=unclassified Paenibacillus TaxID=185978 RepID=UPI000881346F|nr:MULTISPECIES: hypothetical protein [unclassified Paenibacillus]SDK51493.1 hypothetical protein SAMN05428961_102312 [Paenibacillus sp. OK060]SLJ88917.1 hypothetical protein SAMN06272722_101281 [Paenibacillus sp. RU5A]SOC61356.1 hypothetical protein SAMN05880581_101910 [Paenibacillus sp. RU26A]SOC68414.1 hypothetical protein SAMN05880586_101909 [Paenibacillus sp. RU5M]
MKLLDLQGYASPEDSKTHIHIPFELEEGCVKLNLRLQYTPKTLENRENALRLLEESYDLYILPEHREYAIANADRHLPLKNLITLSLDDARGYRGACHRQDEVQDLYVSEREASPGLMAGELVPGPWSVTLSLHCIVTDTCTYRLEVWTTEEDSI